MFTHHFIFSPSRWIGEGRITFSVSPEHLHFYTQWLIEKEEDRAIQGQQQVQMEGGEENVNNIFVFTNILQKTFAIELTNDQLGTVKGKGVIDAKTIAWEFREHEFFEGFEVYELQDNGDYMLHAEYVSPDQFRTIIDGRIWQKE
jgi:hypothetical protein